MVHESMCCGMATETFGFECMGMLVDTQLVCDRKPAAQRFLQAHRAKQVKHLVANFEEAIHGGGIDLMQHSQQFCLVKETPDCVTFGGPCQPYTRHRDHKRCPADRHEGYPVTFDYWMQYLRKRQPRGWVSEQVLGFGDKQAGHENTHLARFCQECAAMGYYIHVHSLDAGLWSEGDRARLPMCNHIKIARHASSK